MFRRSKLLLVLAPRALDLIKWRWFLLGWSQSGRGHHGESLPITHKGVRSILRAEFDRLNK